MPRFVNCVKVNIGYILQVLDGQDLTNLRITANNVPTDAAFESCVIDNSTNPPTLLVYFTSSTKTTGFLLPVCATGKAHDKGW